MEQVGKEAGYYLVLVQNSGGVVIAECSADSHLSGSSIHAESNPMVFIRVVPGFLGESLYSRALMRPFSRSIKDPNPGL